MFGRDAVGVLAPLPFVFGAQVLAKRSSAKAATLRHRRFRVGADPDNYPRTRGGMR